MYLKFKKKNSDTLPWIIKKLRCRDTVGFIAYSPIQNKYLLDSYTLFDKNELAEIVSFIEQLEKNAETKKQ